MVVVVIIVIVIIEVVIMVLCGFLFDCFVLFIYLRMIFNFVFVVFLWYFLLFIRMCSENVLFV